MAPRETSKVTPKLQRTIVKTSSTKTKTMSVTTLKKTTTTTIKKPIAQVADKTPKQNKVINNNRQRTTTVPKDNKTTPAPGSVTKSAKKATWNRRPKPAHSGVPVPEKMKKYFEKRIQEFECSF